MSDLLTRFDFQELPVRGELVTLPETFRTALDRHAYPAAVALPLGEALAAVALMASTLKLQGSLVLQLQGSGPLSLLMVACTNQGELRGIVRYDETADWTQPLTWATLVGTGHCALTIDPDDGERYQGIVALEGNGLSDVLSHYFQQSEQLPTRFWLFSDAEGWAGGLLLQALPEAEADAHVAEQWSHITVLADTLRANELRQETHETLLYRLFHQDQVRWLEEHSLHFQCRCSRQRSWQALSAIEPQELASLLDEQDGTITVDCQFCFARYTFDRIDVQGHGGSETVQ